MTQPTGFISEEFPHPQYVCKLKRSLYGLRQAPRAWYDTLKASLLDMNFRRCVSDQSLFFQSTSSGIILILIYVDDILITGDDQGCVKKVIEMLKNRFKLRHMGQVSYFLGIEVKHTDSGFELNQQKYLLDLLDKTKLQDCEPCSSPMAVNTKLSKGDGESFDNPFLYRSTVGALQYLTVTRPDIAFCVNKLSQFMHSPTELHWKACKRLLQYLKGTPTDGLKFTASSSNCLEAYADADWAGCQDRRRSTGGHCVFFGSNLVLWSSRKQNVVSRSSAEAEYRSIADAAADLIWLNGLCKELGVGVQTPHILWCDNNSAIALASNAVFHGRTKHVEVDVHFVRERVASKLIEVAHVTSKEQVADVFTKPLTEDRFHCLRNKLCMKIGV